MKNIAKKIIESGALCIRDDQDKNNLFKYSSGNHGPGYIMIKGLCGQPSILKFLTKELAQKIYNEIGHDYINNDFFINGNVTGGVVPSWILQNELSNIIGHEIPYVYLRVGRKEGGHCEIITGD